MKTIAAGVPQGTVPGPILYLLYTRDLPDRGKIIVTALADYTATLTVVNEVEAANEALEL